MNLRTEIKKLRAGDILPSRFIRQYSHDASLFEVRPKIAIAPRTAGDIKKLVEFVLKNKGLSLTPRAAGTDMSGGPLTESIVLDMVRHFDRIEKVAACGEQSRTDGYAIAQPGVYYRDFEKATLRKGLIMPSYPASREICTIGGMVANNAGGEKTLTYGQTKNYVAGLKMVLADGNEYKIRPLNEQELKAKIAQKDFEGNIYEKVFDLVKKNQEFLQTHKPRVSKNSAGYFLWDIWDGETFDLTKLFTGSQGTLGIITEIKFNLIKPKKHHKLLVIFLHKLDRLGDIATTVLKYSPESFESYDDKTLKLALKFLPGFIKLLGKNILSLAWQFLPEIWMFLTGGMPKLILMAEFAGDTEHEVDLQINKALWALQPFKVPLHVAKNEDETKKYWTIRRESFNLLRNHLKNQRTAPFIDDMVVQPKDLPKFLPRLEKIMKPYHLVYSVAGHIGNGNFHIIPLIKLNDPKITKIIPELSKKVYDLILEFHGSITGEHNDGLIRSPFLKQMYGERMYRLFERTKETFDPNNIFNPGKKVGGDFGYAMKHLQS